MPLLKRQMFGRAGFHLLRFCVLRRLIWPSAELVVKAGRAR